MRGHRLSLSGRLTLAAGLAVLLAAALAGPASASRYVAMGDSYSAGTGLPESDFDIDATCHRSSKAYGPLIKDALGAGNSFRFSACTGARTYHITGTAQHPDDPATPEPDYPPQADTLGPDTLDATISIGGNDAGFGDVLLQCGYPMVSCDGDIDTAQSYITNTLPGVLDGVYNRIRLRAPNARVGVLGYPRLFPADGDDCSAATFFSSGEIARLNQTADMLADTVRSRARAHGFTFVDSRPAFLGHAWCENEWINGLSNPTHKSYHPNAAGYQGFAGITRAALLAAPAPDFHRGANGRIAFTAGRDGNDEIYVANADGSHPVNLTGNPAADQAPSFSPDGMKIAFASNRGNADPENFDIYVMDWDGSDVHRLVGHAANDYDPAWSPNGEQIVFRGFREGDNEIFKINADGSPLWDGAAIHQLTDNDASDFLPSFSPDGAEIVFQRWSSAGGNEIYKMGANGQESSATNHGEINLTNNASAINDGAPQFSPDGSQIAFHSNRDGDFEIYTMGATGGTATKRTSNAADDRNPAWAPSGTQISFQSDRDGFQRVYTMTSSGGSQTRRTNGSGDDSSPSWQGDARAPESEITAAPPADSNQSSASFAFTSDELGSTFECRMGNGAWGSCVSPFSTGTLGDGAHIFSVRAIDPAGNVEGSPSQWAFSIDTQAKVSEITGGPAGPTNNGSPEFRFVSENPDVTFECRLVRGGVPDGWADCVSPWPAGSLTDGEYRFEVRGTDAVNNVEDPPQGIDFQVDTVAPNASLAAGPAQVGADPTPTFELTADEPGVSYECRLESATEPGNWQACDSPFQRTTPLDDGDWTFSVRATDLAGNLGPAAAGYQFTVDTEAPGSEITAAPGARHSSPDVSFEFGSADAGARFECRIDSLDEADWQHCESPFEATGLNHGQHEFQVRAIDQAGNAQPTPTSRQFGIDLSPNYAVTQRPTDPSASSRPTFGFSSDDPDAFFTCSLDGGPWEECATPYDPTLGGPGLADGRHTMEIRGTDSFGDTVQLDPVNWVIDTDSSTVTILSGPPSPDNSPSATFTVDPGRSGVTLMCKIDGWDWVACPGGVDDGEPRQVVFGDLLDASHELQVRADGPLSGPGAPVSYTWKIDTTPPPVAVTAGPRGRTATREATFEFGSGESGTSFECRLDEVAFSVCSSPRGLGTLADGQHRFEVRARDEAGNASAPAVRTWTVDTRGPAVTLTQVPAGGSAPGRVELGFESAEPGSAFSCRLDGGEWLPCRSPYPLDVRAGAHSFEVKAADDLGNEGEPDSHSWTARSQDKSRPAIQIKRRLKLGRKARVAIATVRCATECKLTAPRRVKVTSGRKSIKVPLVSPRRITGKGTVRLKVTGRLRRAVKLAPGRLKLTLRAASEAGSARSTARVTLRR